MIKLIASDMDGTLLDSKCRINEEIYDIIKELKNMGITFVVASGRQVQSLKKLFAPVDNEVIYLAENGAYVVCQGVELYSNILEKELIEELVEDIKKIENAPCFLCGKKHAYAENEELVKFMTQPEFGYDMIKVDSFSKVDDDIVKVSLIDTVDPRERSFKILGPKYRDRLYMAASGYNCLDLLSIDVSKGVAIKEVCSKLNISTSETVAFGDNYNDIEMLEEVGISFAMKNADKYVQSKAKYVIGSNDENAVVETLKKIIEEIKGNEEGCKPRIGL